MAAKKATYAEGGDDVGLALPDGARELSYREGEYAYRDRYYGWDPFAGEEVVAKAGRVVWLMNYFGRCNAECVGVSAVYRFLVKALAQVAEIAPYRGPEVYEEGDFKYVCKVEGDIGSFQGHEKILHGGKNAYWLVFHGGKIAWKSV